MRMTEGRTADPVREIARFAAAVAAILAEHGRLDAVMHNAGQIPRGVGPALRQVGRLRHACGPKPSQ